MCLQSMLSRHKLTYTQYDKYIFDLVKSSVASRHFFLNSQTRFSKKLIEYVMKLPLPADMRDANKDLLLELLETCIAEYWE